MNIDANKFYLRRLLGLVLLCVTMLPASHAQYTIIGQNSYAGTNFYGPMSTSNVSDTFHSRHAYIYPAATLGALRHGDTIRSLEFFKSGTNVYWGNPTFRIYMSMSSAADFGTRNIHWTKEAVKTGTVKVFEGNPATIADSTAGFKRFDFNQALFVFDSTQGSNLKILVEFIQYQRQPTPVSWVYENDFTVPYFISNNEGKFRSGAGLPADSTNNSNLRKPYIKINYPRYKTNVEVNKIYCLGRVPTLMNRPDSVMAIVGNSGLKTVYNHKIFIRVKGANNFLDSITLDSLQPYQTKMVVFGSHQPDTQGTETIYVFAGKDDYASDDMDSVARIVGYNVYSHADPFSGIAGGIGFNGSSGDFVAKFYTDSIIYINQIKVDFSQGGRGFQLGIWNQNSAGLPGTNIFTSDTLTSVAGTYVLSVLPRVQINGGYFVGIRQTGTTNVAFAYQPETPVRPNAFYFAAPLGDTSWVPFSPGFDFKFNIQPRIQVGHDVAVLRIDYPSFGDTLEYNQTDSIAPRATIINYGFVDQKAPFDVVCRITNQFGQLMYADTITMTIKSNDTANLTFSNRMSLNTFGKMRMQVFTKLSGDKVYDNDTMTSEFDVVVRHDVALENYFDPMEGQKFQMNSDRVGPVVRVANFGANTKNNIYVTSRIRQGNKIAQVQTKTISLAGSGSAIVSFDSFVIPWWGDVIFEAFCWGVVDSFHINDTFRVNVYVDKSHDIGVQSVVKPLEGSRVVRKTAFQPYANLRNYGVKDQDTVLVTARITNAKGNVIYTDQTKISIVKFSTSQVLLKSFTVPDTVGTLTFRIITHLPQDQDRSNDTAYSNFNVVTGNDIAVRELVEPIKDLLYNTSTAFAPKASVQNIGNSPIASAPVFYCTIHDGTGTLVYMDSAIINAGLAVGAYDTVQFGKVYNGVIKDLYTCRIWHKWAIDGEKSNDETSGKFSISYDYSVKAVRIEIPGNGVNYNYNGGNFTPRFVLKNDGLKDVKSKTNYKFSITTEAAEVYGEIGTVDTLLYGQEKVITVSKPFVFNTIGRYTATLIINNADDAYHADDTLMVNFRVVKNYDVQVKNFVEPTAGGNLLVNRTYAPKASFVNLGDSALNIPFSVSFIIFDGGSILYNSNVSITMGVGEEKTIQFDSSFVAPDRGIYTAMAIARQGMDQERGNDTITTTFTADFASGIQKTSFTTFNIFPNPSSSKLYLTYNTSETPKIELYNALGQGILLRPLELHDNTMVFDVSTLADGMYFVRLRWNEESVFNTLMIQH